MPDIERGSGSSETKCPVWRAACRLSLASSQNPENEKHPISRVVEVNSEKQRHPMNSPRKTNAMHLWWFKKRYFHLFSSVCVFVRIHECMHIRVWLCMSVPSEAEREHWVSSTTFCLYL